MGAEPPAPNIVLILTDDQRWDEVATMPIVSSELAGRGVTFTRGYVVNALCCPSRSTILTGKYSHGTGVYTNDAVNHGGRAAFLDDEASTVATWLDAAGYRTALIGKYLNEYEGPDVPPGWDRWSAFIDPPTYFNYTLIEDGVAQAYGDSDAEYATDVLAAKAVDFIRDTPADSALFLAFTPFAPHGPATPPLRYVEAFPTLGRWRYPNYNEADVSDKPAWVQALPGLTVRDTDRLARTRRMRLQSLLAVDDAVGAILQALQDTGRLSETLIVFTSDNGFLLGAHRVAGKRAAYEESIRVPFVVRYDPLTAGMATRQARLVLNLDLAPTFAAAAAVDAPGSEGRSLLPLLGASPPPWRKDFLIEHLLDDRLPIPTYCAVRNRTHKYVEYATGEVELYDLAADRFELVNRAGDPQYAGIQSSMRDRMAVLCSPPPPGFLIGSA